MADVYLSYSHRDRIAAERIAAALRRAGLTVWFDPSLRGNDVGSEQLLREVNSASTVVVLWSAHSANSEWVKREVSQADHLISVYLEPIPQQINSGMHLAVDLSEWNGSPEDPQLQRLVRGIRAEIELDPLILLGDPRYAPPDAPSAPVGIPPTGYDPLGDVSGRDSNTSKPTKDGAQPQRTTTPPPTHAPAPPPSRSPRGGDPDDPFYMPGTTRPRPGRERRPAPNETKRDVSPQRTMVAVNCPNVIGSGWQTIRAYLFPAVAEAEIVDDAKRLRDRAEGQHISGQAAVSQIKLGTIVTVILELPNTECHPRRRRFVWRGRWQKSDFAVRYAGAQRNRQTGSVSWFAGVVCIAQLPLDVQLTNEYEKRPSSSTVTAPGYESVFVSYSTKDSTIVDWLETTYKALGMTYLRDVNALRSGEKWDEALLKLIQGADLFQLCWSTNAKQSLEVTNEWRFALGLQKPNFIRPCYWDEPMPEPPPELRQLHFSRLKLNWFARTWFRLRASFA